MDLLYFDIDEGPLTSVLLAIDTYSRYITCIRVLERATAKNTVNALDKAFRTEGKPRVVITDNGMQFCAGLENQTHAFVTFLTSKKTHHLRIPFRQPRKNGIVERAVQNVKREAIRPFKNGDAVSVQQRLFHWRNWYNFQRKHAGIENKRPAELFRPNKQRTGLEYVKDVLLEEFVGCTM